MKFIEIIRTLRDDFCKANVGHEDDSLTEKFKNFTGYVNERHGLSDESFMMRVTDNLQWEYEKSILAYTEAGREKLLRLTYPEDSYTYKYIHEHIDEIRDHMDECLLSSKVNDSGHKAEIVERYLGQCFFDNDNGFEEMRQHAPQELYNQHVRTIADMVDEYDKGLEDAGVTKGWGLFATLADNIGGSDLKEVSDVSGNFRMWKIKDEIRKEADSPQLVAAQGSSTIDSSAGRISVEF